MNPMALVQIVMAILSAAPQIIGDVEKIIADLKGTQGPAPLKPASEVDMKALYDALLAPAKP